MTRNRILCQFHSEATPSMVLYPETGTFRCYGCGKYGRLEELKGITTAQLSVSQVQSENIDETLEYIDSLPRAQIRGLELPRDADSYYVVWPDRSYYKRRIIDCENPGGKYRSPRGVARTPFVLRSQARRGACVLVEGEINALSLGLLQPPCDIVCPGSAGDFGNLGRLPVAAPGRYEKILIWCDNDAAGASAAIKAKAYLNDKCKKVEIFLGDEDANDVLCRYGQEALQKILFHKLDLPQRL